MKQIVSKLVVGTRSSLDHSPLSNPPLNQAGGKRMKTYLQFLLTSLTLFLMMGCEQSRNAQEAGPSGSSATVDRAQNIVERCIEAHGGIESWRALQDVHYREKRVRFRNTPQAVVQDPNSGDSISTRDIYLKRNEDGDLMVRIEVTGGSLEQLRPDGFPGGQRFEGKTVMGYDGQQFWEIREGQRVTDPEILKSTRFLTMAWRYWFSMPFVLKDSGARLQYKGESSIDDKPVYLIEVTFDPGTGDNPEDRYVYSINRETYLVENLRFWLKNRERYREFRMRNYIPVAGFLHDTLRLYHNHLGEHDGIKETEIVSVNSGLSNDLFYPDD